MSIFTMLRFQRSITRPPGHLRYPAVQRYIHDLSMEMGEHIDTITATLSMFVEVGEIDPPSSCGTSILMPHRRSYYPVRAEARCLQSS